jgi:hypothetical protein
MMTASAERPSGRAGLVRARTALVNIDRGLAKSCGERLGGCNVRNLNPDKAEGLSPELQAALQPRLKSTSFRGQRVGLECVRPIRIVGLIEGKSADRRSSIVEKS